jgi:hypothetical protein
MCRVLCPVAAADGGCRRHNVRELVCLGGFKNVRKDFDWEGFKLELDETQFEWGTVYEIEVETVRAPGCSESFLDPKIHQRYHVCPVPRGSCTPVTRFH